MKVKFALHSQILIALILAVGAGTLSGTEAGIFGIRWLSLYEFLGTLFLNALKMLVVPLIVSSIICGVMNLSGGDNLRKLGLWTVTYYLGTGLIAVAIGVALVNVIEPGIVDGQPAREVIGLSEDTATVTERVQGRDAGDVVAIFLRMVPPNIVAAAAEGQMLGLIFFSLLFGFFISRLGRDDLRTAQQNFWQGLYEIMMRITDLVIRFAPIGVFGLVAAVAAKTGISAIRPLAWFMVTVLSALAVHMLVVLPACLVVLAGVSPIRHFKAVAPALLTAFSTSSSSATLPLTLECVEERAGVSNKTSSFVLPLGATVNMDGTALFECVAALFIAQAYGLSLGLGEQFSILLTALLTSIGVAGIPSASLVAIAVILTMVGLPLEGLGLILAVDRILDMSRTAVNVFGDTCGAVIVARWRGETNVLQPQPASSA